MNIGSSLQINNFIYSRKEAYKHNKYLNSNKHYMFSQLFNKSYSAVSSSSSSNTNTVFNTNMIVGGDSRIAKNRLPIINGFLETSRHNTINFTKQNYYLVDIRHSINNENRCLDYSNSYNIIASKLTIGFANYNSNNTININLKCVLCIKQEYIYYVKLCMLTGSEIEFDCFYLLIEDGFLGPNDDSTSRQLKQCRSIYKSRIKPVVEEYGIPIQIVDNMDDELFVKVKVPPTKTIGEYTKWLDSIVDEWFQHEAKTISNKNIKVDVILDEIPF